MRNSETVLTIALHSKGHRLKVEMVEATPSMTLLKIVLGKFLGRNACLQGSMERRCGDRNWLSSN